MPKLPYFNWYPADAETDQEWIAMTYEARGVYMTLLNRSWLNTGIAGELKELARQLHIPYGKFQKIWSQISAKFPPGEGGRLFNPRQEEERSEAISKSKSAGNAAASRWDKKRNADAMRSHTVCIADGMPRAYDIESVSGSSVVSKTEKATNGVVTEFDVPAAFEILWAEFPQGGRERKTFARSVFFDRMSDRSPPDREALFADMLAGLERWRASSRWAGGAIHGIANWIGERLWEETPLPADEAARLAERGRSRASRMPDLFG